MRQKFHRATPIKDDPSGDLLIWFEVLERAERRPDHSLIFYAQRRQARLVPQRKRANAGAPCRAYR